MASDGKQMILVTDVRNRMRIALTFQLNFREHLIQLSWEKKLVAHWPQATEQNSQAMRLQSHKGTPSPFLIVAFLPCAKDGGTDTFLHPTIAVQKSCRKKLQRLEICVRVFLETKRRLMLKAIRAGRQVELDPLIKFCGHSYFDGRQVCSQFSREVFHLENRMLRNVHMSVARATPSCAGIEVDRNDRTKHVRGSKDEKQGKECIITRLERTASWRIEKFLTTASCTYMLF